MTLTSELEAQLIQLSPDDKLYLIQVLAKSLNGACHPVPQPATDSLSSFFQRSPLADIVADGELDLKRDRALPTERIVL
ncbi:MAG: hypothetical protein F6K30_01030 [Cyanothece sp. SIO2G6]|nr:hypothetical protein [Cyanothece sp. SIO2G6]